MAGKGFSVVADEIRKLAEQSNAFTQEIAAILSDLTKGSKEAVSLLQKVEETTTLQNNSVSKTDENFNGVAGAIVKIDASFCSFICKQSPSK